MTANVPFFFGLVAGILAGVVSFIRKHSWLRALGMALLFFAGFAMLPLNGIFTGVVLALALTELAYRLTRRKWLSLLVALPGVVPAAWASAGLFQLYFLQNLSATSLGSALAKGVGLGLLLLYYVGSSIVGYLATVVGVTLLRKA
ncbi:MAG TPA: hypothetical protein ENN60_00430 [archaeon]|nr:hypothetical protein [archaeon]